jgi:hypothetical protein
MAEAVLLGLIGQTRGDEMHVGLGLAAVFTAS